MHYFVKFIKIYIHTFPRKPMVANGNFLQIAQNQANFTEKYTVMRVGTFLSYGNMFHYGLTMLVDFENLSYLN